ncbi:hypothetical protein JY651_36695 [Pyxidicoccus parkwayensis]|uniref:B box-type domain-containing protein n=1 Tax=Pyxidicoccus parkwayensis TaxID=2813578 RepID=A0ABX7NTM3_9BACT|nr:hypothetical protein [Pyxidicoccus parkwaysis]QSQ20731.1 hypothetical protein JY651_36695 [Pyxidicoccus parkwaysis]
MSSPAGQYSPDAVANSCRNHPSVASREACTRCGESYCGVCLFTLASGAVCPACIMRPGIGGSNGALMHGLGGLGLALVGMVLMGAMMLAPVVTGEELKEPFATIVGMAAMLTSFGGVSLSFVARDLARGTNATLPMVGIVANTLLTILLVLLSVVGAFMS